MKNNDELYSLYKETGIMTMIKTARFKWLGHTASMEDNVPGMKIKLSKREGSRKKEGLE